MNSYQFFVSFDHRLMKTLLCLISVCASRSCHMRHAGPFRPTSLSSVWQSCCVPRTPFLSISHAFISVPTSKRQEAETMNRWGPQRSGYCCCSYVHKQHGVLLQRSFCLFRSLPTFTESKIASAEQPSNWVKLLQSLLLFLLIVYSWNDSQ